MSSYTPAGRLGDPNLQVINDPRLDARLVNLLKSFGMDKNEPGTQVTIDSPMEDITAMVARTEDLGAALYAGLPNELPGDDKEPKVDHSEVIIPGPDGNDIALHVFRTAGTSGETLPCVIYSHGGGMVNNSMINKPHVRWLTDLALAGVVAIGIDFRNAYTQAGHNPFPAGLNDCAAGVQYIAAHKADWGIDKIILQGESGGCNLAFATALKANKEGWIGSIDGVYGVVPYISNAYGWPRERLLRELPSCIENDGYFLSLKSMAVFGHYYTPDEKDKTNPLAWPYHATADDVKGLPPHYLLMDELDPLRDEGNSYYRKLGAAGVPVTAHVNLGTLHGSALLFRQALPEFHAAVVDSIAAFARRLPAHVGTHSRL
ncbi:hypothetical protein LTR36_007960 [Oleoguttula mirabilis]|uniref:Alpha/beta hydrolase fold-3 domain-containing protein n=1 Tax=Oleoguttula mirabilis TaxID=1507867 RepID=A0AAV9J9F7_9PEZI|nr:hypothetical protein LTR36_007960 [Oleoguttula mirabilis]